MQAAAWEVVCLDLPPVVRPGMRAIPSEGIPSVAWEATSLLLERAPDLTVNWLEPAWTDHELDVWQSALMAVCQRLPPGQRHLVLAWPDEALWSTAITLAGPLTADELQSWLPEELDAVLPGGLEAAAWDCFPPLPTDPSGSLQGASRRTWWQHLLLLGGPAHTQQHSPGDVVVRCWAMPVAWARALVVLSARLGLASLRVEPGSLARSRTTRQAGVESLQATRPTVLTAYGAACRHHDDGPDLLRRLHLPWAWRVRRWVEVHLPWLLVLVATGSTGLATGAWQARMWRDATQQQEGRWRQLQSQLDERKQGQAQQLREKQQALELARQQRARLSHNLQYVQALNGLAASLPEGVHWQAVSLHQQQMAIQAVASDSQALTHWMNRWPDAFPTGVQPQLHWQPSSAQGIPSRGQGAVPETQTAMDIDLQLNLSSPTQGQE